MLGRMYDTQVCSIARALELVGERWSLLLVRNALFAGITRFGDTQRSLGIATNVLSARLDAFVAAGIMERREDGGQVEYLLTPQGRELAPVLIALTEWGDRWAAPAGPPILYRHSDCGGAVGVHVACEHCGRTVGPDDIQAVDGPGMPAGYRESPRRPARA